MMMMLIKGTIYGIITHPLTVRVILERPNTINMPNRGTENCGEQIWPRNRGN